MGIVLHQFASSHFNEKVRWALAHKQLLHERKTYLPGPHIPAIKRVSGQNQTPVLQIDDRFIAGSAAIIDELERQYPHNPLYPESVSEREAALAVQKRFDEVVGPAVRTVFFSVLIHHPDYLCRTFAKGKSRLKMLGYRAMLPLASPLIAKGNGVNDPKNIRRAFETVSMVLNEIPRTVKSTGYLQGGQFCIADLTAASLIAPLAAIEHEDMARPRPMPDAISELLASYAEHPGIEWVRDVYRQNR